MNCIDFLKVTLRNYLDFLKASLKNCLDLLEHARVIRKIRSISHIGLPLGVGCSDKRFKAAVLDIGFMQKLARISVSSELQYADLLAIYRGKLAEQFVAQELLASHKSEAFYWSRDERGSSAEVDFVVEKGNMIIPLEVKSDKGGSLRSMHLMLKEYDACQTGIILYSGKFAERPEKRLSFISLYYAGMF